MPTCGSQGILCDFPVRFDTYRNCSHACAYCFANKKADIANAPVPFETAKTFVNWCEGSRDDRTKWVDWKLPLHWGGMSDGFQPIEKKFGESRRVLEVAAKNQYPLIISTKGKIVTEKPYIDLLGEANVVLQISAVAPEFDRIERGAPTYAERMKIAAIMSRVVRRVVIRVQPYSPSIQKSLLASLPAIAKTGAHGITVEGMKFFRGGKPDAPTDTLGSERLYRYEMMRDRFLEIRDRAHDLGLAFYAAENRLRWMGDSLTCCGTDGVPGFVPCSYNVNRAFFGGKMVQTPAMNLEGGGMFLITSSGQKTTTARYLKRMSFADAIDMSVKVESVRKMMGVPDSLADQVRYGKDKR